ncbi:osmotically inducible protein OsmC [Salipiger aestuarii]|uniref:Osmotically inducible protein OsmC n=1 Tax=Salipiger aestuarii TaxID=568098 RepID=A0A327YD18_9RHOB|nr:OsmC family protein [Salipiger aestuarii]EIE51944.1 osmotically inducible protein OsmC [Citreicella sp. 357]KAB2542425.1 osmotically inducible protein OsmC [Salipiger aestuarii]RAK18754.1 osmotically inducible protein OsmC [Salipiger aestuarii]
MIDKKGSAHWKGGLKDGTGTISTGSGALDGVNYGFNKRFEGAAGSNPEELIAAAHASCFSMALSMILGDAGLTADDISTEATVSLEQKDDGFAVTKSHLVVRATVPNASEQEFADAANAAKANCPISKLLNAEITMEATLG